MTESSIPERFEILEEISRNRAEILLRARDRVLLREVVLKRPNPVVLGLEDTKFVERTLREAQMLAQVRHPGVVRLHEVIETSCGPILVMEPVAGQMLSERLSKRTRLPPESVRRLGIALCEALEAVHAVGVVHRGISIDNIVLRADGTPCLIGFVFAKFGAVGNAIPGTTFMYRRASSSFSAHVPQVQPQHPAPEQVRGQAADARSDVFGLGWVLYQCLTGDVPYPQDRDPEHWIAPRDARAKAPDARKSLVEAIHRCLNPSPLKRFASASEVRAALEAAAPRETVAATTASRFRLPALVLAAMAAVLVVVHEVRSDQTVDASLHAATPGERERGIASDVPSPRTYAEKFDKSYALLIGIGKPYSKAGMVGLVNAERDVLALQGQLHGMKWENWKITTRLGSDATRSCIREDLHHLVEKTGPDDRVFVYFAGHGEKDKRSENLGWIIPADGKNPESDPLHDSWLPFDDLHYFFEQSSAKHILIALDCCYGGRLAQLRSPGASAFERKFLTCRAHTVISSGRSNERVSDGVGGRNSPFAAAFLKALNDPGGKGVLSSTLFARIQSELAEYPDQTPEMTSPDGTSSGEFVFVIPP